MPHPVKHAREAAKQAKAAHDLQAILMRYEILFYRCFTAVAPAEDLGSGPQLTPSWHILRIVNSNKCSVFIHEVLDICASYCYVCAPRKPGYRINKLCSTVEPPRRVPFGSLASG